FALVFVIGAATAAVLNNDAAILLLTPMIVPMIARRFPRRSYLVAPFAFAVFSSAGIAPLATSNPMTLVVAERVGIGFNAYALRMAPVALVASIVSFLAIRRVYKSMLDDTEAATGPERGSLAELPSAAKWVLAVLGATLVAYPILS